MPNLAKAEQSGWFVGVQGGYDITRFNSEVGGLTTQTTQAARKCSYIDTTLNSNPTLCLNKPIGQWTLDGAPSVRDTKDRDILKTSYDFKGYSLGLLGGYKHFFNSYFGLRFYGLFDTKFFNGDGEDFSRFQSYNLNLNVDMLLNFYTKDDESAGIFVGASAGGVQYMQGSQRLVSDVNLGINMGLRMNFGKHGIEFFSRFGSYGLLRRQKDNDKVSYGHSQETRVSSEQMKCEYYSVNNDTGRVTKGIEKNCDWMGNANLKGVTHESWVSGNRTYYFNRDKITEIQQVGQTITKDTIYEGKKVDTFDTRYQIGIRYIYSF